jgi:hypothetical protein
METLSANVEAIAQTLADAYTLNRPVVDAAFRPPADLLEAAEIQADVAKRLNAHVSGWKVMEGRLYARKHACRRADFRPLPEAERRPFPAAGRRRLGRGAGNRLPSGR